MKNNKYKEIFIKNNIKATKQRAFIFDILMKADRPLSVEEIFVQLVSKKNIMNLSTIYRILNVFTSKDLIVKNNIYNNKSVFEVKGKRHKHHLTCVCCGKMLALDNCPIKKYEKTLEEMTSFKITGHKLEFFGFCSNCKGKSTEENKKD